MKSSEVSIKTRSTPASLSFRGQATKHTTVKWSIVRIHSLAKTMWPANEIRPTSPVLAPVVQRDDISILIHWIKSIWFDISYPLDCPIQPLSNRGLIFRTSAPLVRENKMSRTSHLDVPRTSLDLSYA